MTTISPRRKKGRPSPATIALVVLLAAAFISVSVWRTQAQGIFWVVVAPVVSLRNSLDETDTARLKAALASTTAALADRDALYRQNLYIKSQFGKDASTRAILGAVLLRPPGVPYDTLIIDAGTRDGVVHGALVSAGGSTYIGTVSDVYTTTSRVTLFSSPGSAYDALIVLSAQAGVTIPISLTGQGAGSMSAQVPASTPVSVGDAIVVPGIAAAFAGSVSHVEKLLGDSFETVYTHLPVDLFSLQFVEVRLPPQAVKP